MKLVDAAPRGWVFMFSATLCLGILVPAPAYAYVDPGSGQLLLQALGVVFFGAVFYVRQIIAFLRRILRRD